jgi:pimeloyl-ACP methyl ester carboxylesterase
MRLSYCIWAVLLSGAVEAGLSAGSAAAQNPPPASRPTGYTVFLQGAPIGREDISVQADPNGVAITIQARRNPPAVVASGAAEIRYRADGSPESLLLESNNEGKAFRLRTIFKDGTAVSEGAFTRTDTVSRDTLVLPTGFFGAYAALSPRLEKVEAGAELRAYLVPQSEVGFRVGAVTAQRIQTGAVSLAVKRYDLVFANPIGNVIVSLTVDSAGGLVSVRIPSQAIDMVRDDVSSATSRTQTHSNPGDEPVTIPATGFNLGATLTRPAQASGRLPAVILLSDSAVNDRDGAIAGVPVIGELAGALAQAGLLAVRFDKRGYGQSGGRAESATLADFADDTVSVVKWLANRRDIDPKRIAVVGHNEGAWIALLAAAREKRIAAVVSIAAPSVNGNERVLEQQRQAFEDLKIPEAERQARIELQTKINTAVITGRGWEALPADVRRQADTPWFQSRLMFNPQAVLDDIRQPMLFVHGELDKQVPVAHVEKFADLARKESKSKSVSVVTVRGVNHLLVPAVTGDVDEYGTLPDRNLSGDVTTAINDWLMKTFQAIR